MAQKHASIDLTQWCVQKFGELTDSGYNEIIARVKTKDSGMKLARHIYGAQWRKHVMIVHQTGVTLAQNGGYTSPTVKTNT